MFRGNQQGVTLVEVIIVLAITAILGATVIFGQDQLRGRQEFGQGVDQLVETLAHARNETASTVGQVSVTGGTSCDSGTCAYIYGKSIQMAQNSSAVIISTVTTSNGNPTNAVVNAQADQYTVQLPWQIKFSGNMYLLFGFQSGGSIAAYSSPNLGDLPANGGVKNGSMVAIPAVPVSFHVYNSSFDATITVDQFGNITRTIN